mmetsp:Transcript_24107/g.37195  ORF Transcript_24107/g.37195 Transcript_24107/m.37195 type:complete len:194 (+) Transcript_24107:178-759(+)
MAESGSTLVPPRLLYVNANNPMDDIECSIHTLPKPLAREFEHVFGDNYLLGFEAANAARDDVKVFAVPTNQRAREDLVNIGDHIEMEKDRLLNVFMDFGRTFCERVRAKGYWADYIDPCSGLPMLTKHCNKVYSEVDGMEVLLNYRSYNAGFCKILTHPKWGSAVYPASVFVHAPFSVVKEAFDTYQVSPASS